MAPCGRLGRLVVEDFGLPPHDYDILMSPVSDGSSISEHSEDLQIHGTVFMLSALPNILSFLISGHLCADYHRRSGLLGFPTC